METNRGASVATSGSEQAVADRSDVAAPTISLPKGGGAIRGMGEKFAANPVTGTGSMSVPIATSPGRSGFGPQLSLSYDSGAGNGPCGFGWGLSLPAIRRKTDKGLPQYRDSEESDVFILSGAEDLVPVLQPDGTRFKDDTTFPGYVIHRYRPRIEGLFARIERWTKVASGEIHWRSITRDNVTTLYGKDNNSRIFDPADPSPANPTSVFSWLISVSYDDKGNAIVYEYAEENDDNVDIAQAHERNRVRTANRYLKRIKYGNRVSRLVQPDLTIAEWLFEVVFDYDEAHHVEVDLDPARPEAEQHRFVQATSVAGQPWPVRRDPFSSYSSCFEVRTYRRCRRVLMFHHIPDLPTGEKGYDGLVRSTEFDYGDLDYGHPVAIEDELAHQGSTRFASFIRAVTQSGYVRDDTQPIAVRNGVQYTTYLKKSLPPLEFEYSKAAIQDQVLELDAESLENLPTGLDGSTYQWVDLDGEGVSGILTEQAGAWFYKPNLGDGRFGPLQTVAAKPSLAALSSGRQQLLDLAGDGQLDLVAFAGPTPGFYERTFDEDWAPYRTFRQLPNIPWDDPNLRFADLDGDGHADVLITEQDVFNWHPSLAEEGFAAARTVRQPMDEERGPRLVFADGTQSIYLADMCGDGLTDLVRIRNGGVCYWPNLGYGRFGTKVTMDNAPWFDNPDQFDQRRVRLADIDGSGTNDVIYLARDGVRLYFNQSGNRLSEARGLTQFPRVDNIASVMTADLLGNGTACLVWSSPLPAEARQPLRYIDLMSGTKPHLLIKSGNNLGAETEIHYAPSTRFYLADKRDGRPWVTRLPFPVHVVERVVTRDRISGNHFVTRYAYHHGYFDGIEREFRGFGMVEQWDTEEFAALNPGGQASSGTNVDASSHVPPVLTKTWFHTGVYLGREHVSNFFAGLLDANDVGEYYREPGLNNVQARAFLLADTVLPDGLTVDEAREACRALKGSMLRQEVYARDGTDEERYPYAVIEQNFTIRQLQPRSGNRHGVFFTHARESLSYHYERDPADPRIGHTLTLEVDDFGNILQAADIGYGRRQPDMGLSPADQAKQAQVFITFTENRVTTAIDTADDHCTPLPSESREYELTGLPLPAGSDRFTFDEVLDAGTTAIALDYEKDPTAGRLEKRLIEHVRTYYRRNDLAGPLPLGELQSLALPFENYKLAFTPGLVERGFGGRVTDAMLGGTGATAGGHYVHTEGDANWWISSGQIFYCPDPADAPAQELAYARQHFFLPHRYRDPFHTNAVSTESFVTYDGYDQLVLETRDALGNRVTVGERLPNGDLEPTKPGNDYRVLQARRVMDPNRNRSQIAVDTLGIVVGTAVMGKPEEYLGDSLDGFSADLTAAEILDHLANPLSDPHAILGRATTRLVYDLFAFQRTKDQPKPQPSVAYTLARETHDADLQAGQQTKIQHSFSYSDGFGREIQKKIQAEPEKINGVTGPPRWVGSGWTIFNNKGKPVRQYESFFSDLPPEGGHRFEFGLQVGVSPILFYDPVGRVVATLHPNHTWEKMVFDPWRQETWDVNDTVLVFDPSTDADVGDFFGRLGNTDYLPTWHALRADATHAATLAARYPDATNRTNETRAAEKALGHAATPTVAHADSLGRTFLTVAHNKVACPDHEFDGTEERLSTRVELDIEGNQRAVIDAKDRVVMRYAYDLLGNHIHQTSMEAGARWMLNDVTGKPIRAWDSRAHSFRTEYDPLRRPLRSFVTGADPANLTKELLTERLVYGEQHPQAERFNLRGVVYLHLDQAGATSTEANDFKGNPLGASRRIAIDYKHAIDWNAVDAALPANTATAFDPTTLEAALVPVVSREDQAYTSRTTYDALNRPVTLITPHTPAMQPSVIRPGYNEANLLERVDTSLRGATVNGEADWTPFVSNIDYDAKGQRQRIDYGNGASTFYDYDPLTFRLTQLLTRRDAIAFPDDCPEPPRNGWPGCQVQNLHYSYDPAGNITHIRDDAQQTIYFKNKRVEPSAEYTYDALYRLIQATGREHLGQIGGAPIPHSHHDAGRVGIVSADASGGFAPNDGNAMGTYIERYLYDQVGNFMEMQHRGSDPAHAGWTRHYGYSETSLIEDGIGGAPLKTSNRLSSTTVGNNNPMTEDYAYDAHGNMTEMPHLSMMQWDYRDQLQATSQQVNNGGTPEITYYVYDAAGQRVRKVTERANGTRRKERIYLGGVEIYRDYDGDGDARALERETLHIMDDKQRIALVETKTWGSGNAAELDDSVIRYQLGNHLGSASLELDRGGAVISYEEYSPYGSTSYQAGRSSAEISLKRYRYTGMERDEETRFNYHGARYLAGWLGRWVTCDPKGITEGVNVYLYAEASPVRLVDRDGMETITPESLALELHAVKPNANQTINVLQTNNGTLIVTTAGAKLNKAQLALVDKTAAATLGPQSPSCGHHAENLGLEKAGKLGETPIRGYSTNKVCSFCRDANYKGPSGGRSAAGVARAGGYKLVVGEGGRSYRYILDESPAMKPPAQKETAPAPPKPRSTGGGGRSSSGSKPPQGAEPSTGTGTKRTAPNIDAHGSIGGITSKGFMLLDLYSMAKGAIAVANGADPLEVFWSTPSSYPTGTPEYIESLPVGQEVELNPRPESPNRETRKGTVQADANGRKYIQWTSGPDIS